MYKNDDENAGRNIIKGPRSQDNGEKLNGRSEIRTLGSRPSPSPASEAQRGASSDLPEQERGTLHAHAIPVRQNR